METTAAALRQPKYKHTREIVKIALAEGLTQDDIAKLCRVQQSMVSGWANGSKKARAEVIAPLVKRYSHRLNRTTSRFYLVQDEPTPPWDGTEQAKLVERLEKDAEGFAREHMTKAEIHNFIEKFVKRREVPQEPPDDDREPVFEPITDADRAEALKTADWRTAPPVVQGWTRLAAQVGVSARSRRDHGRSIIVQGLQDAHMATFARFVRLEGAVVWRHTLGAPRGITRRGSSLVLMEAHGRWVVHAVGDGTFRLVIQVLRQLPHVDRADWPVRDSMDKHDCRLISDDDAARWISTLHGPFDVTSLITKIESLLPAAGPQDRAVAPFTLRKSLVEHGYDVPDVQFIAAL